MQRGDKAMGRFRRKTPLVTQAELAGLLKEDRSEIVKELRVADSIRRHPHRAAFSSSSSMIYGWKDFISWLDSAVEYLQQARSVSELEQVVRDWQERREVIQMPTMRFAKRADVIPTEGE